MKRKNTIITLDELWFGPERSFLSPFFCFRLELDDIFNRDWNKKLSRLLTFDEEADFHSTGSIMDLFN